MLVLKDDPPVEGVPPTGRPWKQMLLLRLVILAVAGLALKPAFVDPSAPPAPEPEFPTLELPSVSLPRLRLPEINLARASLPRLRLPDLVASRGATGSKTPRATWREYGHLFRRHAAGPVTPDFLAALAQVESSGDPDARPGTWLYRPTSAAGLLQMTKGNFEDASRLSPPAFGRSRYSPADAVELTAGYLDFHVKRSLRGRAASLRQRQELAAVIHLCGPGRGPEFVKTGFEPEALGNCGAHAVGPYVRHVLRRRREFERLAEAS